MKVRDLIKQLSNFPKDSDILIEFEYDMGYAWGSGPVTKITEDPEGYVVISSEDTYNVKEVKA